MKKVAVVSGVSGQLGPVWCETLTEMGFEVFGMDLPKVDVSKRDQVAAAAEECLSDKGIPKVLILNAGIDTPPGKQATFWADSFRILSVNLIGAANVVEVFHKWMIDNGGGNIVFIGSMLGFIASDYRNYTPPFDKPWAYGASKAGMWKLCKDLAVRFSKNGLIFNMLALSGVEGKQYGDFKAKYAAKIPIERMLRKEDFVEEFRTCVTAKVPYDMPLFVGGGYTLW